MVWQHKQEQQQVSPIMLAYALRRPVASALTLLMVAFAVFWLMKLSPISPIQDTRIGHLDLPLPVQVA